LIRVGAVGATAALAAPVVRSIVAPTPAQAGVQSCVQSGAQCGTFDGKGCNTQGFVQCCTSGQQMLGCAPSGKAAVGDPCTCQGSL
jgi:hypothetical protein